MQTASGTRYTRDGSFTRDAAGVLTTHNGDPVLGAERAHHPAGCRLSIGADGSVLVDDAAVGKSGWSSSAPEVELKRVGQNAFVPRTDGVQPGAASGSLLHQGTVEASNVDLTGTMTHRDRASAGL